VNRSAKLLWGAFAGTCVLVFFVWLSACGGAIPEPKRAQAKSCIELANEALGEAYSCEQARAAVARVVENAPSCAALFGLHLNLDGDAGVVRCDD
jgi:hypothetical protein